MQVAARSRRFARLFVVAGSALAILGTVPWIVFVVGGDTSDPTLLVLATVAIVGGIFVALVGLGFLRRLDALERAADERRLDAALLAGTVAPAAGGQSNATVGDCGESCATCTASCALNALRS